MRIAACATAFTFVVSSAWADAANGERLAQRWCTPCHAVGNNETRSTSKAPPLTTIARNPEFSRDKLALFLLVFHPNMPDVSLTRNEASDLADYIATLGGNH